MDVYIAFTEKQQDKIDNWKKALPKVKAIRSFGIQFYPTNERNKNNHLLFKAIMKSSDGYKLVVTRKAAFH